MSAIAGIYHFNEESINLQQCHNLMSALQKYPADSIQMWHSERFSLVVMLNGSPESVGEQLPFYDFERQCTITADAIIDNRDELFQRLQVKPSAQRA